MEQCLIVGCDPLIKPGENTGDVSNFSDRSFLFIPEERRIVVNIKERRTGALTIGALLLLCWSLEV
jgi:hypothetical protein